MNKEDLYCLIGNYLNGYKIIDIEDDPFIKGQINLWTDSTKNNNDFFNEMSVIKFYVRNQPSQAKIYQEQVDKENYELKSIMKEIRELINNLPNDEYIGYWKKDIFEILDKENK